MEGTYNDYGMDGTCILIMVWKEQITHKSDDCGMPHEETWAARYGVSRSFDGNASGTMQGNVRRVRSINVYRRTLLLAHINNTVGG